MKQIKFVKQVSKGAIIISDFHNRFKPVKTSTLNADGDEFAKVMKNLKPGDLITFIIKKKGSE